MTVYAAEENSPMRIQFPLTIFVTLLFLFSPVALIACTTAVISGKATKDGRPLLWKNRDRSFVHNEVIQIADGKYRAVAVVNAGGKKSIWMGVNAAGFCIENSVTNDLGVAGAKGPDNGAFMYQALISCATIEDFEKLLEKTNSSGRNTKANFGVIDAQGGASLFETSATSFTKFDANDPQVAPHGVIVRANFSMTGQSIEQSVTPEELAEIPSAERYLRAQELMNDRLEEGLDAAYIIRHCMRDMADEQGCCHPGTVNLKDETLPAFIGTKSTISRTTTVSAAVFHGVKAGEDPRFTTMWVSLGDPKFSIAVPCWVGIPQVAPELTAQENGSFTYLARSLRDAFFDAEENGVRTEGMKELWQELWTVEDGIFATTERNLNLWRKRAPQPREMGTSHLAAARRAYRVLQDQERILRQPQAVSRK